MSNRDYIFGSKDIELKRLSFQHRVWLQQTMDLWKKAKVQTGMKVLDVGCGPGLTTIDLSNIVTDKGQVVGIDKSEKFINYLNAIIEGESISNVKTLNNELMDFEYENSYFDIAYSRWVFSWVKNPEEIIKRITPTIKKGGKFIFQEYYNWHSLKIHPQNPKFDLIRQGAFESWKEIDGTINIGQTLPNILNNNGFEILSLHPLSRIGKPGEMVWEWIIGFLQIYSEILIDMKLLDKSDLEKFKNELPKIEAQNDAFLFAPQMIEIIAEKK